MVKTFYKCPFCGNVIVKVVDSGITPYCCGFEMVEIEEKNAEFEHCKKEFTKCCSK